MLVALPPEIVFVSFVLTPWMMSKLQAGYQPAVNEERGSKPCAERNDQFDAFALHCRQSLNRSIVCDSHRLLPTPGEYFLQFEPNPLGVKVVSGKGGASFHDSRESNRHPVESSEIPGEGIQHFDDCIRGCGIGRFEALPGSNRPAGFVQQASLYSAATDV